MIFTVSSGIGVLWIFTGMASPRQYQGLTNPLSGCPGQVKMFAEQVKFFRICPEKCISYIEKVTHFTFFQADLFYRTSR